MGQIIYGKQMPRYCNLAAIQTGGSKADTVLANGEIWLVDTTNATKVNGTGVYDAYIKGDGSTAAKNLTVELINDNGGIVIVEAWETVDGNKVYNDFMSGKPVILVSEGNYLPVEEISPTHMVFSEKDINEATIYYYKWTVANGWMAGELSLATTDEVSAKQDAISDLSTIRSGAAAGATAVQPAAMNTALAAKQDTLTFDNAPTANSNNPVKSGGVKTAIDAKQDTISTVNVTVDNNTGTPSGSASVSGSTLSLSFQNLKGATGAQGPQGIQGVPGPQGPKGDTGVTGDASSLAIIHGIDKTTSYASTDVCGADAAQALLNEIEGGFYY